MTWFRVGGAGIPAALKNAMNAVFNKKFGTSGQNYPPKQWPDEVNLLGPLPEGTATGSIAHITDGSDEVPIKSWDVTLPASLDGYSSVEVVSTGKNLSSVSEYPDNPWNFWGTNFTDMVSFLNTLKSGQYTISFDFEVETVPDSGDIQYGLPYIRALVGGNYVNLTSYSISAESSVSVGDIIRVSASFTLTSEHVGNVSKVYIYCDRKDNHSGTGRGSYNLINAQVEIGSTATTYEQYVTPTTHTASLGRTIYGGSVDVVNGEGREENTKFTVTADMADSIRYIGSGDTAYIQIVKSPASNNRWQDLVCSHFTPANIYSGGTQQGIGCYSTQFYIRDSRFTSKQDFLDFLTEQETLGTPLEICYKLATPTDFAFTPISPTPKTALGTNNFWADTGDTTVVYRRDIDLALQAVSSSRGLMMASRPVTQLVGEESDPDQVNELVENNEEVIPEQLNEVVENDETEQEGENDAR